MINSMEVREDDEEFENPVDIMFRELKEKTPNHFAVRQYAKYRLAAGKTAKSILVSCGARLAVFDIAELHEVTAYDELELDTLGGEPQKFCVNNHPIKRSLPARHGCPSPSYQPYSRKSASLCAPKA